MANGDLLYHIPIYRTALKEDGTYDFHENFEYVKPWLKQADLVIGDFEGTVNKDHYLAGYPLLMLQEKSWMQSRMQATKF